MQSYRAKQFSNIRDLTETWLDQSFESISLPGYIEISRRDRGTSAHGGVILFAKFGYENTIVHLGNSEVAERSWHIIHSVTGPLLFGAWYRPPSHAETASIDSLEREVREHGRDTMGTIFVGDMNVHEASWLKYSDGTSPEGRALRDVAYCHGWEERVRKPTRGEHLLDLVLTDLGSAVTTKVAVGISDHKVVLGAVDVGVSRQEAASREVFLFGQAPWPAIRKRLQEHKWEDEFADLNADDTAKVFEETILKKIAGASADQNNFQHGFISPLAKRQMSQCHRQKAGRIRDGPGGERARPLFEGPA